MNMVAENPPRYTRHFWAKAHPYRQRGPERIHLLEHHLADVGACFEALLAQPTIRDRLARSGGLESLDDAMASRLSVFAALHDIGKANIGFQAKVWRKDDGPPPLPPGCGHTSDVMPLLTGDDRVTGGKFFDALGWWDDFESWDDRGGDTVYQLLVATLSHHGMPLSPDSAAGRGNPRLWRPYGELDPMAFVSRMGVLLRKWFPSAFEEGAPPLPSRPAFQHHFLGLLTLADWLGSDESHFPFVERPDPDYMQRARRLARQAARAAGLDISAQREEFAGVPDVAGLFGFAEPRAIQRQTALDTPLNAPVVIIESETGSGKTEAALWRFARMYEAGLVDGMYFALPTRAAAAQIHRRVKQFAHNLFPGAHGPDVVLAVPGYDAPGGLPDYSTGYDSGHDHAHDRGAPWASERPKKFLTAQIAVGTVDQAMLGALQVKHAHLRSAPLARNLLVVDEVHASDVYMSGILRNALSAHTGAGGYALLMSATLGSSARESWLAPGAGVAAPPLDIDDAKAQAYPSVSVATGLTPAGVNDQDKEVDLVAVSEMNDFEAVSRRALAAARSGARTLVIRNTVGHAIRTRQALEEIAGADDARLMFQVGGRQTLHHGRFAAGDRRLLDRQVETDLGKAKDRAPGGKVVLGTQTLEQSLDIDADLLITDLCPVDVLLQRIGRLHRHRRDDRPDGCRKAQCVVLTPDGGDLSALLKRSRNANGLGPYGGVYEDLLALEATRRLVAAEPRAVWRIPAMNRELVEEATHPTALAAILSEMAREDVRWQEHDIALRGKRLADLGNAASGVIHFDQPFGEHEQFPDRNEQSIRTRLGDDRVEIRFNPCGASPFDASDVERLAMPLGWLRGEGVPTEAVATEPAGDGFEFGIGKQRFRYDRLGLRRN